MTAAMLLLTTASGASMPCVTGRVGSSRWQMFCNHNDSLGPLSPAHWSGTSFPIHHMTTLGLFLKWRTKFTISFSAHSPNTVWYPFWTLAVAHSSNDSAMTIIPISSQALINSGAGILCEVRMALQPISFNIRICRRIPASLAIPPNGPKSWWLQTPLNCTRLPFRKNPSPCRTSTVRMPKVVEYWSFSTSPSYIFEIEV